MDSFPSSSHLRNRHVRLEEMSDDTHTNIARVTNGDTDVYYPNDDNHGFFAKGRDFESAFVNHRYTNEERKILASYDSLDYLPSHSTAFKTWLKTQPSRLDWDRWIMMGLIGFTVGFIGFLLHQIIDVISDFKWKTASQFIEEDQLLVAWGFVLGYSCLFVLVAAALVVFICPSAGGSGIPEVIGFLNGTIVRYIFNVKTMFVKFFSCCCAVGSGMPVGPEGPMIHMGSLVGAGLSQFKSDTMGFKLPYFERFRNSEDRRNFISAGAAAGVASAFGAPVGGLLFSMEEVSSFWNMRLSWQIFFCAMTSTFTTDLFNSAFTGFRYQGQFGMFKADKYIMFQVDSEIAVNILAFIPALALGVIGGVLGALFTFMSLKFARGRKRLLASVRNIVVQKVIRLLEPILVMIVVSTVSLFLPQAFDCTPFTCMPASLNGSVSENCINDTTNSLYTEADVEKYMCPEGKLYSNETTTYTNGTYNQLATLLFVTGEEAIHHLFSRNTHLQFTYAALFTCLLFYFLAACWAAGTSISSGLVVPMLFIGGLYGRIVGYFMVDMFGVHVGADSYWAWMDPGAFALVGAASFFGGVSRLTMSLTVIMMEITNDVQFLLPIMATIMVAKWVGDFITHPLYHALLELKCIPFLDTEPIIVSDKKKMVNLELFQVSDVMTKEPQVVRVKESVFHLANLLRSNEHGGYPVIKSDKNNAKLFFGFINRMDLLVLLKKEELFKKFDQLEACDDNPAIKYQDINIDKITKPGVMEELLTIYTNETKYQELYVSLEPYVNQSAVTLQGKFSLHRAYIIFRTLGLRHLTIVNERNQVIGIVTRKDLMGFSMEEKLADHKDTVCTPSLRPPTPELNINYPT